MTASIRRLLADVANEAYAQWWNDEMGEIQQIPDLIVDALLASPLADIIDLATWMATSTTHEVSPENRERLVAWFQERRDAERRANR